MGSFKEILCTECNFKIVTEGYDNFYIDSQNEELKEFMFLKMTTIDHPLIYGYTERTYCPNCDKIIKTFIITESKYSNEESIKKLEEIIKKPTLMKVKTLIY